MKPVGSLKLRHIEAFNAVMLTGSVSAAARLLHRTQPAITQTLQHAESTLGYQLFARKANGLVPTAEAQTIYPEVRRLMAQLETIKRVTSAVGDRDALRILCAPSLGARLIPRVVSALPKSAVGPLSISCMQSFEVATSMALREGEIGIVYGHVSHPALSAEKIANGRLVCVSREPPSGVATSSIALEEVFSRPVIRIASGDPLGALLSDHYARSGLGATRSSDQDVVVDTHHLAMCLAEADGGVAIVDSFTAGSSFVAGLCVRDIEPEIPVDIYALTPAGIEPTSRVGYLLQTLRLVAAGPASS